MFVHYEYYDAQGRWGTLVRYSFMKDIATVIDKGEKLGLQKNSDSAHYLSLYNVRNISSEGCILAERAHSASLCT